MGEILFGAGALVLIVALLYAFIGANPTALVRGLRYLAAFAIALAAIGLAWADRVGLAIFAGSIAWGMFTGGHAWPGGWPHYNFGGGGRSARAGQSSTVSTPWIEMILDHDSGEMDGHVLRGRHEGETLSGMIQEALLQFRQEAGGDEETLRLLDAYLDRRFGATWHGGRSSQDGQTGSSNEPSATGMSRKEALSVLGLSEGASEEDIRAAHRKLMLQNHPDRGGSDYLASKINEAKDVLLDD